MDREWLTEWKASKNMAINIVSDWVLFVMQCLLVMAPSFSPTFTNPNIYRALRAIRTQIKKETENISELIHQTNMQLNTLFFIIIFQQVKFYSKKLFVIWRCSLYFFPFFKKLKTDSCLIPYILGTTSPPSISPSYSPPPSLLPQIQSHSVSFFRKEQASKRSHSNRTKHDTRQGRRPYINTGKGNTTGGKDSQEKAKESRDIPASTVRDPTETPALSCGIYAEDLAQTHAGHLLATSASVSPCQPCLVGSVDPVLLVSSILFDSHSFSLSSSRKIPWFPRGGTPWGFQI